MHQTTPRRVVTIITSPYKVSSAPNAALSAHGPPSLAECSNPAPRRVVFEARATDRESRHPGTLSLCQYGRATNVGAAMTKNPGTGLSVCGPQSHHVGPWPRGPCNQYGNPCSAYNKAALAPFQRTAIGPTMFPAVSHWLCAATQRAGKHMPAISQHIPFEAS